MKKLFTLITSAFLTWGAFATVDTIQVANFSYTPSSLTIDLGDTVRFLLISGTHPTVSDNGSWGTFTLPSANSTQDIILTSDGAYQYHCSAHGSMTGTITVLDTSVVTPTSISTQPTDENGTEGGSASFSIVTVNEDSLQWQLDSGSGSGFSDLNGETSSTLSLTNLTTAMDGNMYRCQVFGSSTLTSNVVTLSVDSLPQNTSATILVKNDFYDPEILNVEVNDTVIFQWVEGNHPTESITGAFPTFQMNDTDTENKLTFSSEGTYEYFCQFHGGSDGSGMAGKIIVGNPQSISSNINNTFIVAPSPVENSLSIIHNYTNLDNIIILNIAGQEMYKFNIKDYRSLNVSNLKPGMYFVKAMDIKGNVLNNSKIIKK